MGENYFTQLYNIDVSKDVEEKNGLSYLSWAKCWAKVKTLFPESEFEVIKNADGIFYHTDGRTCWVETSVTINGVTHTEYLPVMNNRNQAISAKEVTSCEVNKAIQRSLTKACARHGLGLYIYEGEDIPPAVAEIKIINEESVTIAKNKASKSAAMKTKVGKLVREYAPTGNPRTIKELDKAKQLNEKLKEMEIAEDEK